MASATVKGLWARRKRRADGRSRGRRQVRTSEPHPCTWKADEGTRGQEDKGVMNDVAMNSLLREGEERSAALPGNGWGGGGEKGWAGGGRDNLSP